MEQGASALSVGTALRRLRERRGLSLSAVAMGLGWNYRRMHGIEHGQRAVRYAEVLVLLELYESDWSELNFVEEDRE